MANPRSCGLVLLAMALTSFWSVAMADAPPRQVHRVLFLGNSLTSHAPVAGLNWQGDWGMAASSRHRDFVHQTYAKIAAWQGFKPALYISGRHTRTAGRIAWALAALDEVKAIAPDMVVVQLGENERDSGDAFHQEYRTLIAALAQLEGKPLLVCVGTWHPRQRTDPVTWDEDGAMESKDMAIKAIAREFGAIFVGTSPVGHDERNSAKDQDHFPPPVQWHPGDGGMAGYAEVIFEKLKPALVPAVDRADPVADQVTGIVPEPRLFQPNGERGLALGDRPILWVDVDRDPLVDRGAELLQEDFRRLYGLELMVAHRALHRGGNAVLLTDGVDEVDGIPAVFTDAVRALPLRHAEGYVLASGPEGVFAEGLTPIGTLYAIQTLRQMLGLNREVVPGLIADQPDQALRVVYLGYPRDPEWIVQTMARLKINLCIVESRWDSENNWWYNPSEKNRREAEDFIALCRAYGIEVAPLVQGLGWAYGVVGIHPGCAEGIAVEDQILVAGSDEPVSFPHRNLVVTEAAPIHLRAADGETVYIEGEDYEILPGVTRRPFADNHAPWRLKRLSGGRIMPGQRLRASYNYMNFSPLQTPYCPSEPETYRITDEVLTQVVTTYKPRYLHIGRDEVIYQRRCSRCLQSGKTQEELMGGDIRQWIDKIKALNPDTRIMMWEDLLRPNPSGEAVLRYVPEDVIICPWEYRSSPDARGWVARLLDHLVVKHQRPTLGTVSNYFLENSVDWKRAGELYRDNPLYLGFMFSDWGREPTLWGKLAFSANLMWAARPAADQAEQIAATTWFRRHYGVELNLGIDFPGQMALLAARADRFRRAGGEDTVFGQVAERFLVQLLEKRYPIFARADLAVGTFPENTATQLWRFAMLNQGLNRYDAGTWESVLAEFKVVEPKHADRVNALAETARADGKALTPESLWGISLAPRAPFQIDGEVWPLDGGTVSASVSDAIVYDFGQDWALCGVAATEPATYGIAVSRDGRNFMDVAAQSSGNAQIWPPVTARYLRLAGSPPVKIQAFALKRGDTVVAGEMTDDWRDRAAWDGRPRVGNFITPFGMLESLPVTAAMAYDDTHLYVDFRMAATHLPGRQIKAILNPSPSEVAFYEITVPEVGPVVAMRHGHEDSVLKNLDVVHRQENGQWNCTFAVPWTWLAAQPEALPNFAVNFLAKIPENRDFSSWMPLPPAAKFWHNQQPTGNVSIVE